MGVIGRMKNIIEWCEWFVPYMKSDRTERLSMGKPQTEPIHVLMNGPTLKQSIHLVDKFPGKVLMVNSAILHLETFGNVKPDYYCLADPGYFKSTDGLGVKTWNCLNHYKAPLELFVPNFAKNKFKLENSNIQVRHVVAVPVPNGKCKYEILRKNTGAPAFQGVVVMGIYVALQLGFKKIYLHGAEQKDKKRFVNGQNEVCVKDIHVYDGNPIIVNLTKECGLHMLDECYAGVNLYKNLYLLKDYSAICAAEIINMSTDSMIDCFERYYKDVL